MTITALSPVDEALRLLPPACPGQTDPIGGLFNSFLEPGFSFAPAYGADRWFTSAAVQVPLSRLRATRRLRIHLMQTRRGGATRKPRRQLAITVRQLRIARPWESLSA